MDFFNLKNDLVFLVWGLFFWFGFLVNVFVFGMVNLELNFEDFNFLEMFIFLVVKNLLNRICFFFVDFFVYVD